MQRETKQIAIDFAHPVEEQASVDIVPDAGEVEIEHDNYPDAETLAIALNNLHELKDASKSGKKIILNEHYNILRTFTVADQLVLEAVWTGTLAVPIGNIPAGEEMQAYIEQHYSLNFSEALRRRNYDDFEPIS